MTKYKHQEWGQLIGVPVEIRRKHELIREGIVDDAMPDSSIVSISADKHYARTLFEAAQGFEVWVEPRQLQGSLAYRLTTSAL